MREIQVYIDGMTCENCQKRIGRKLKKSSGILAASVSYETGTAKVLYDETEASPAKIIATIESLGYMASEQKSGDAGRLKLFLAIAGLYIILQVTGTLNLLAPSELADSRMSLWAFFVLGLFTSIHCVAMCGGINLSQSLSDVKSITPSVVYNFGRVLSYTSAGFVFGFAGKIAGATAGASMPVNVQALLKAVAGVLMFMMGAKMLNLFPALRRFTLRLPKITAIRSRSPFIVGLMNGFMPCGPLQAMWIASLASGSPLNGALSMMSFGLGTVPLMLGLGSIVSALGRRFSRTVMTSGAVMVCVMGLVMLSQGLSIVGVMPSAIEEVSGQEPERVEDVQVVRSVLSPGSYPSIRVKAGVPVKWVIDAPKGSVNGCNYKMYIYDYGIEHTFMTGENVITFTPEKAGNVGYSCWMGMIRGNIAVY